MVSAFALAGCKKTEAPKKYSVIFMNGDTQISEQTVEANKEAVKPDDPTKESSVSTVYTFAGWALTADGEVVTDFTIKADTTFYAVYTPSARKYTVKFMDGENQLSSAEVDYDAQATKPADPTKAADAKYTYTFAGWALTADGDAVTDFKVTGDVTYYAVYTSVVNKYDVKFMLDGEQIGATQNIDYDTAPTMPETPTKTATAEYTYTFAGWYTAAEGGEKVEDFTVKGNATYYGRFTAVKNKYTVKFIDGNGEEMTENAQTLDYGSEIELPAEPVAESGYYFAGWKTEGGKFWQESDVLEKNETLTATFEKYFGTILDDCVYGIDYGVGGGFAVSQEKVAGFEKVYEQEVSNDWQTDLSHVSIADYKELRFAVKSDAQITSDKFSSGAVLFDGGVWYTFVLTSIEGGWNVKVLGTEYDYTHFNPDGRGICAVLYHGTSGWGFGVRAGGTAGAYKVYCTELRGEKKIVPVVGTIVDDCVYGTDPGIGAGFAVTKSEVALGFEKAYERDIDNDWQADLSHVDISAYSELRFALKTDGKISSDSADGAVLFDGGVWYTFVLTKVENGWNVKVLGTDYNYTHVAPGSRGVCDIVYHGTNGWGLGVRLNGAATPCKVYCTELRGVIGSEA